MSEAGERGGFRDRIVDDYAGHKLYDERGGKVGKVEYTILDTEGKPEYLAVKTGFFGSNTTLIPEGIARPGERDKEFAVQASEDQIKEAPTFGDEDDVTPDFEDRVLSHFGLGRGSGSSDSASAGAAAGSSSESRDRESRGTRDDEPRDRDSGHSEGRRDRDDRGRDDQDRDEDRRSSETGSGSRDAAAAGGSMARDDDRRGDDRSSSGSLSGGGREKVRVTVKRERARAERVRGEDGSEEVRIRKEMVEEEEMVEVEDRI